MANYNVLKAAIEAAVYPNGRQEVDGTEVQTILKGMVDALGSGYTFAGIATPTTATPTTDARVFYLATEQGRYFNAVNISDGELGVITYDGTITLHTAPIIASSAVTAIAEAAAEAKAEDVIASFKAEYEEELEELREYAETAANAANTAATSAQTQAELACEKAGIAAQQAEVARLKAEAADTAAQGANDAKAAANTAASTANTAAANADAKATAAANAADDALAAAGSVQAAKAAALAAAGTATTAAGTANTAAAAANAAATEAKNLPYIDEDTKTWMVYNATTHEYEDSEVAADDAQKADKVTTATAGHIATLTAGGNLADGGVEASDLARRDGYYEGMGVGTADNLAGRANDAVPASFTFRPAGGTADIADGTATVTEVKGKTIIWNQTYKTPYNDAIFNGVRYQKVDNVTMHLSGASTARYYNHLDYSITTTSGHWYYIRQTFSDKTIVPDNNSLYFYDDGHGLSLNNRFAAIQRATANHHIILRVSENAVLDTDIALCFIDLTQMFGAGNEPATVEEFEAIFPQPYYAYNAGTLLSLNATAIQSVGFNAFDLTTGTAHVVGGMEYEVVGSYTSLTLDGEAITPDADDKFTPSHSGTLTVIGGDSTTCIHLVHSGYRDGEFEEHWSFTRNLNLDAFGGSMKSVGDVHDTMTATQDIQCIGEREYQEGDEDDPAVLTDGTMTQYVLDEPVVTDYDDPRNLSYRVGDFGTEAILPQGVDEDGVPASAPLMADITYGINAVDTLRNLPKNYISKASFDDFCAKLGTAIGATITATFDGSKYVYTITPNTSES